MEKTSTITAPEDYLNLLQDDTNQDLHLSGQLNQLAKNTADTELQFMLLTEAKCFDLYLSDGALTPVIECTNVVHTDINGLNEKETAYIKSRTVVETDPFLRPDITISYFKKNGISSMLLMPSQLIKYYHSYILRDYPKSVIVPMT